MKKTLTICVLAGVVLLASGAAFADKANLQRPDKSEGGRSGTSNVAFLYLQAVDEHGEVIKGIWGKMKYNLSGETLDVLFNGHGLEPGTECDLIAHPGGVLGSGIVNAGGNIHIQASGETESLADAAVLLVSGHTVLLSGTRLIAFEKIADDAGDDAHGDGDADDDAHDGDDADDDDDKGRAGKSNVGHVDFCALDPDTSEIVADGATGKMTYKMSGPTLDLVFNGHGLEPGTEYTLIYYPAPHGIGLVCLGSGIVNRGGNLHITGSTETDSLPIEADENHDGAQIVLVLTDDVNCEQAEMRPDGYPAAYLYGCELITFERIVDDVHDDADDADDDKGKGKDKDKDKGKGPRGRKSNTAHLNLAAPVTDEVGEDAARGKMRYILSGSEFKFGLGGHGLVPGTECMLTAGDQELGAGTVNGGGNLLIKGSVDTGDLGSEDAGVEVVLVGADGAVLLVGAETIVFDDTDVP